MYNILLLNPNNIPDFRNVVLYELSFLLVGILDFGIEKWKANVTRPSTNFTLIFSYKGQSTIKCFSSSISPLEQFVNFLSDLIMFLYLPVSIFNNIPDFRNVVLYELSFLLVGILDFGIEKWKANDNLK
jgi:hypothetical protein